MKRTLTEIAGWLTAEGQRMDGVIVSGVSIDSRTVKRGDLFIPFRGEHANGHRYVEKAVEQGAAAALWLKDEPNPPENIPLIFVNDAEKALQEMARSYRDQLTCTVIGITGSNGKTSTKDLVASTLTPSFNVLKTEGNFNNELGLPLTLLSLEEDTEVAVLEMGMSGFGEISFLSKLAKPHYVVITNIGEAHMQDLGSREGIAKAKFEIIDGLQEGGKLFYDGDEALLQKLVAQTDVAAISFGYAAESDLSLVNIASGDEGSRFTVSGIVEGEFTIPIYGAHQVKNALSAILIAKELSLSLPNIQTALKSAALTTMRMQPILTANGTLFIHDAYNAAPTSMRAALDFIRDTHLRDEKWIVLGDMLELGDNEQHYHEMLADPIANLQLAGILLYGSRMKWLYDELQKRDTKAQLVWSEQDYEPLIEALHQQAAADTIVLLKGSRGMALENVLEGFQGKVTGR